VENVGKGDMRKINFQKAFEESRFLTMVVYILAAIACILLAIS
jgi:hypothetical protein